MIILIDIVIFIVTFIRSNPFTFTFSCYFGFDLILLLDCL